MADEVGAGKVRIRRGKKLRLELGEVLGLGERLGLGLGYVKEKGLGLNLDKG